MKWIKQIDTNYPLVAVEVRVMGSNGEEAKAFNWPDLGGNPKFMYEEFKELDFKVVEWKPIRESDMILHKTGR